MVGVSVTTAVAAQKIIRSEWLSKVVKTLKDLKERLEPSSPHPIQDDREEGIETFLRRGAYASHYPLGANIIYFFFYSEGPRA